MEFYALNTNTSFYNKQKKTEGQKNKGIEGKKEKNEV